MTKNKILISTFSFPPQGGGVSRVTWDHANFFAKAGYEVTVATSHHPDRKQIHLPDNIRVFEFCVSGNAQIGVGYHGEIEKFQQFVAGFDCDFIFCHCWQIWSTDLAVPSFKHSRAKKILVSHGVSANTMSVQGKLKSIYNWLRWRPYVFRMTQKIHCFDHVVFLADKKDKDRFYDRLLADKIGYANYSIIPNGIDLAIWDDAPSDFVSRYGIKSPFLLTVGNYSTLKNEVFVLKSYIAAAPDCNMVFIGTQYNKYTKKLIEMWGKNRPRLPGREVYFLENVPEELIRAAYHECTVFLSGSRTESFSLVVVQAMASSVPFISTTVGAVAQFPGGYVVKNTYEMAEKIRELLGNEHLRRQLGEKGRQACADKYNCDFVADAYLKLIKTFAP